MTMDQSAFENIADRTLEKLMDTIDEVLGGHLEADLENAALTIELGSGEQYIINKHNPTRQIWMSSPLSGATHFSYNQAQEKWMNTRGEGDLPSLLSKELETITGIKITLQGASY